MKKVIYIVFLVLFGLIKSSNVSGQQVLWTTMEGIPNEKYIPVENVKSKVLEYYGTYEYYIDGSGYDIDSFLKTFKLGSQIGEFNKKMKEKNVNKLVLCLKTNSGKGSTISVLILGQKNFDMVGFTNVVGDGVQPTYSNIERDRIKFEKWFDTLLE
ncbi:hypothetical protein U8593_00885 [Aquirufa antheringensis]